MNDTIHTLIQFSASTGDKMREHSKAGGEMMIYLRNNTHFNKKTILHGHVNKKKIN